MKFPSPTTIRQASHLKTYLFLLVGALLFAQTATLLHSEVHHFHEHEAECDIYLGMENQSVDLTSVIAQTENNWQASTDNAFKHPHLSLSSNNGFFARAPPTFS